MTLLRIDGLALRTEDGRAPLKALDLEVDRSEIHGLVGESGSGKSLSALSVVRLLPPSVRISSGRIWLDGIDLLECDEKTMEQIRGGRIGFVFQDPMSSLNPTRRISDQISEAARLHLGMSKAESHGRAIDLLREVGIPKASETARAFPHQLSGGMRQRVVLAAALAGDPDLLVADEPTTALDVTIQAQILNLIERLRDSRGLSVLLITHNLGVAARVCDRLTVLYRGRVMESGPISSVFGSPLSPYTQLLIDSVPSMTEVRRFGAGANRVMATSLTTPSIAGWPAACPFVERCPLGRLVCQEAEPPLTARTPDHQARCWATEQGGWAWPVR